MAEIGEPMAVLVDQTVEVEQGWVVFYESARYLQSGSEDDRLMGNGPVFVDRRGRAAKLGTHSPWPVLLTELLKEGAGDGLT